MTDSAVSRVMDNKDTRWANPARWKKKHKDDDAAWIHCCLGADARADLDFSPLKLKGSLLT